jgi:hypothetical protein
VIDKNVVEGLLMRLGEHLANPAVLCVIGSTSSIITGQPDRQTPDIDVWFPGSSFDAGDLRRACEAVGLLYDPQGEVGPDDVYIQVVRPGLVSLPPDFTPEVIGEYGNLRIVMPPPEIVVAAKLARGTESDIEDAVWWVRGRDLSEGQIGDAIERIPSRRNRETARENLILVRLIAFKYDAVGYDGPQ